MNYDLQSKMYIHAHPHEYISKCLLYMLSEIPQTPRPSTASVGKGCLDRSTLGRAATILLLQRSPDTIMYLPSLSEITFSGLIG